MCFLKAYSETNSFKPILEGTGLDTFSVYDKGEYKNKRKTRICEQHVVSFDVSNKDWSDFQGQVEDAIMFLTLNIDMLKKVFNEANVCAAYLDFPMYSRLGPDVGNQNDHIPAELVKLCGDLALGIEISIYEN